MGSGKLEARIDTARSIVTNKAPYFTKLIWGLIYQETSKVKTLAVTEGAVLLYNQQYLTMLQEMYPGEEAAYELAGRLIHEGLHIFNGHANRRGDREPKRWNIACDMPINQMIREMGFKLSDGVFPETYKLEPGLTAETYYELLQSEECEHNGCGGGGGSTPTDVETEMDKLLGRLPDDIEHIKVQVESDIKAYAAEAGRIPHSLQELIRQTKGKPRVDWRKQLGSVLRATVGRVEAGGHDYSLMNPSKRSICRGMIRPGLIQHMPEGAIILDTSGSMSNEQLQYALRESAGVLEQVGLDKIWFVEADADVAVTPKQVSIRDLRSIEIHGRGGTAFGPALVAASALKPRPSFVIYMTDGDCFDAPTQPRGIEVIWALVPDSYRDTPPVPWGKVVRIEK